MEGECPKTSMNVHKSSSEKSSQKAQNQKRKPPRRNKKRMTIWFEPEVYDWLKKTTPNASKFINSILKQIKNEARVYTMIIAPTEGYARMHGPGFEPGLTPRKGVVLPLDYPRLLLLPTQG